MPRPTHVPIGPKDCEFQPFGDLPVDVSLSRDGSPAPHGRHFARGHGTVVALCVVAVLAGCPSPGAGGDSPDVDAGPVLRAVPDLVVDANRDGRLDLTGESDEAGEDGFTASAGAVVIANLDDDDKDGKADADTAALDTDSDLEELAPLSLRAAPGVGDGVTGSLAVDPRVVTRVRLFRLAGGDASLSSNYVSVKLPLALTTDELRNGVEFRVEARDILLTTADPTHGLLDFTLTVSDAAGVTLSSDVVRLRIAPVLFQFNTAPTQTVFHSNGREWTRLIAAGVDAVRGSARRVAIAQSAQDFDPWAQDFFDVGSMVAPAKDGGVHVVKVGVRSAQPDRTAGEFANKLLGVDYASLEIGSSNFDPYTHGYSMNSFGNWDVVPPYTKGATSYPVGRNLWGSGAPRDEQPDDVFVDFVRAQAVQPGITVDTSWLAVGHVDEYLSFVRANTPRGWALLVADPTGAHEMFQQLADDGHGATHLFVGLTTYDLEQEDPPPEDAEVSISQVLADADRLAASQQAAVVIDDEVAAFAAEIGLAQDEIHPVPFLFEQVFGDAIAYQPGTVNLLPVEGKVLVAKPFGPQINGADPFETNLEETFAALGLEVHFVDDWDTYHANMGEVHCGTNVSRDLSVHWWESGR